MPGPYIQLTRLEIQAIRDALAELPSGCKYHGDQLERSTSFTGREACCDTGKPALARKRAERALKTAGL